jgi:plastocyanin
MKTKLFLLLLLLSSTFLGYSKKWTITNSGYSFSPASLTIAYGDSVNFSLASIHNAVEVSQATWNSNGSSSNNGFSTSLGGGLVLPAKLTVGAHYYVCAPHAAGGMKGTIIVQATTGVSEFQLRPEINVYPNPSSGKFRLFINGSEKQPLYDVAIYSMAGEKVLYKSGFKNQVSTEINVTDYPKGIYFLKVGNELVNSEKIVIIQ